MLVFKNNKIFQFINNDYYRRQDLPSAYFHHHYLCCFKINALPHLNNELIYNKTYPVILKKNSEMIPEIDNLKDFIFFKDLKK